MAPSRTDFGELPQGNPTRRKACYHKGFALDISETPFYQEHLFSFSGSPENHFSKREIIKDRLQPRE